MTMTAIARHTDPETSHMAAASVGELRERQYLVLKILRKKPAHGYTDEELIDAYHERLGWPMQSESGLRTRRSELVRLGLVEWSGEKRLMSTGRLARVWRIKK